ncbi:MAG TPA: GNAT family N-acetyltransferase [Acidobacteriota bacterium]|nr:GNAT family N-acetyltransferase [Acidobacteriota bacterium]
MSSETTTDLTIRGMSITDIPDGMRLKEAAGWNQTDVDWRRLLSLEPQGCFVASEGNRVSGTVTTLQYEKRFGWIGMLLTNPDSRRRGIGTRLLHQAVAYLETAGVETLRLDGTPMGYNLYLRHGFVDEYEIQRWEGVSPDGIGRGLPPLQPADLDSVCAWDRRIFGADRSRLIRSLWRENPAFSAVAHFAGEVSGYILWRPGTHAWYLGPWLATSAELAERLLVEMLSRVPDEMVFVDICTKNPWGLDLIKPLGFKYQRPLVRMYRGPNSSPGEPAFVCAIAGPELG